MNSVLGTQVDGSFNTQLWLMTVYLYGILCVYESFSHYLRTVPGKPFIFIGITSSLVSLAHIIFFTTQYELQYAIISYRAGHYPDIAVPLSCLGAT